MRRSTGAARLPLVPDGVALVGHGRPVVDGRLAASAARAAPAEIGVQIVQDLRRDLRDRDIADGRLDRPTDVAAVAVEGGLLGFVAAEPLQRCAQRRFRRGAALLVDLGQQPREDLLRLLSRRMWTR
jgi:hypothetical protein